MTLPPPSDSIDVDAWLMERKRDRPMFANSWFFNDAGHVYPTIEEQVELCRKIASQLVDDDNVQSKGATMFNKRVKRAHKWVHGAPQGGLGSESATDSEATNEDAPPIRLSQGPPKLKLVLDPRGMTNVEKLRARAGDYNLHVGFTQTPDMCAGLVAALNSPEVNKGAALFAKRKEKSEDWVVKEKEKELKTFAADDISTVLPPSTQGQALPAAEVPPSYATLPRKPKPLPEAVRPAPVLLPVSQPTYNYAPLLARAPRGWNAEVAQQSFHHVDLKLSPSGYAPPVHQPQQQQPSFAPAVQQQSYVPPQQQQQQQQQSFVSPVQQNYVPPQQQQHQKLPSFIQQQQKPFVPQPLVNQQPQFFRQQQMPSPQNVQRPGLAPAQPTSLVRLPASRPTFNFRNFNLAPKPFLAAA